MCVCVDAEGKNEVSNEMDKRSYRCRYILTCNSYTGSGSFASPTGQP